MLYHIGDDNRALIGVGTPRGLEGRVDGADGPVAPRHAPGGLQRSVQPAISSSRRLIEVNCVVARNSHLRHGLLVLLCQIVRTRPELAGDLV